MPQGAPPRQQTFRPLLLPRAKKRGARTQASERHGPHRRGVRTPTPRRARAGCNGNGRVLGGLAAIELFSWWPIKAYRPCPECAKRGVRYERSGQTLDEIAFKKNPKGGYYGDDLD